MPILYFVIACGACLLGAICGIGGGVIIKPALDAVGGLSVAEASFASGLAVLAMTVTSLLRGKGREVEPGRSTWLAIGAAIGGVAGKAAFDAVRAGFSAPDTVGAVQAGCLIAVTLYVIWYMLRKSRLKSYDVRHPAACLGLGGALGVVSAFLSIGGGPLNLGVLYLFFSMPAKKAASNSLYIIFFSQAASIAFTLLGGAVPPVNPWAAGMLVAGGVTGGLLGAKVSTKARSEGIEKLFISVMVLIIAISVYNMVRFLT